MLPHERPDQAFLSQKLAPDVDDFVYLRGQSAALDSGFDQLSRDRCNKDCTRCCPTLLVDPDYARPLDELIHRL